MATNYEINYNDERFAEVEADKKAALSEVESTYGGMINAADAYYQKQIDAANAYADEQKRIQQQQTDFAIEQINQQKEQTTKDYIKEQSGAYVDWQKQSNEYGAKAEQMAAMGMANTGYSESSQVSMYNTYQNRVATARETYGRAILNYDNAIKDARLQNSAALAEIAYNALQAQLELSLQGFQYKNNLITAKMDQKQSVNNTYYARYQDVLEQINREQEAIAAQYEIPIAPTPGVEAPVEQPEAKPVPTEPTVDMESVLALGYGPISAATLNDYVESGAVIEYESDGKLKYKRAPVLKKGLKK